MCGSSRIARVESIGPVTVSFVDDDTAVEVPASQTNSALVLTVGDLVMTRTVRRRLFIDYILGV